MRILQLNTYADPIGGAEVYALTLTRELRQRGHVVGFFGTSPKREVDDEHLRVVRRPLYDPLLLWREPAVRLALQAFVRRLQPELIHVHNVHSLGLDVLEALGALGIPTVQSVHDFNMVCPNSWCVRGDGSVCPGGIGAQCFQHGCQKNYPFDAEVVLHALLRHRALSCIVDVSICPSRSLAERMEHHGRKGVVHIPNTIEPIAGSGTDQRQAKELLYVGRLTPEKGVDYLLQALPLIREHDPEVHLTLVAGGSPSTKVVERVRRIAGVSLFLDVPRAELGRFYSTATVCVLPSIWCENAPLVALECLAAGLPMVASHIGGLPELVEDGVTGFTFRPRDPVDLAEKTRRCLALGTEARARMSAALRERSSRFQLAPHVTRIEQLYREVVRRQHGPVAPAIALDGDLLAVLEQLTREKPGGPGELRAPDRRRVLVARLRRVARALHLPKIFPN
ncbi:MAG: glycosyltransferase [Planctomycetes bacterium]|nr:glycosyltransferase [Planctomycetota bacterium]